MDSAVLVLAYWILYSTNNITNYVLPNISGVHPNILKAILVFNRQVNSRTFQISYYLDQGQFF